MFCVCCLQPTHDPLNSKGLGPRPLDCVNCSSQNTLHFSGAAVLGSLPVVLIYPTHEGLHGDWGWTLTTAFLSLSSGTLAPPHSGKLQLLFTMSSTFKASTTWVTFTHDQIWLPAWDAALISMGHSYSVLPLRKYFPKDSPRWCCWSLLNPSRSLRPSSPVLTVWLKKGFTSVLLLSVHHRSIAEDEQNQGFLIKNL